MSPFKLSRVKLRRFFVGMMVLVGAGCLTLMACNQGDTGAGNVGTGTQYVSDGSAGATLTLDVAKTLLVGDTTGFVVTATDPRGQPLPFIRIFCDSEKGISIIEPSAGGVGFESTSATGHMSGVIGGLLRGSYLFECRGPEGSNLVVRESIVIGGEVPANFNGFPGASGGNLGGGSLSQAGVQVRAITFTDAGGEAPSGPIDTVQTLDCDPVTAGNQVEPFTFTNYKVTVQNDTELRVLIQSVHFSIRDSNGSETGTLTVNVPIDAKSTADVIGVLITFLGGQSFAGTNDPVEDGTWSVTVDLTGVTQNGENFQFSANTVLSFDNVNNCSASAS